MNQTQSVTQSVEPYEPPRVESVLTPEDVEREVHYAGRNGLTNLP